VFVTNNHAEQSISPYPIEKSERVVQMGGCCNQSVEVVNTIEEPVVIGEPVAAAAQEGYMFFVTTQSQGLANNASIFLQLTNPANSGRTIHIARIAGTAFTGISTAISYYRNGTFPQAGTALTPVNGNFGTAISSVATVKFINTAGDPVVGGAIFQYLIQPSAGGVIVTDYDGRIVMPPSTSLVIRLLNLQGANNAVAVNLSYWETSLT
jgi:hypothetical protein